MKYFKAWLGIVLFTFLFLYTVFNISLWPGLKAVLYPRVSLPQMLGQHLILVLISSFAAVLAGVPLGIFVTRESGSGFKGIAGDLGALSQTIPPVAVLALAVPLVGFGFKPTVLALFLYSILPILRNTIAGLEEVSPAVKEAARGMGMTRSEILFKVELPLALPVLFAGIRMSVVVNVGTATIGAVVGAGGLGNPIISGIVWNNQAFILEGAVTTAVLAVLLDQIIGRIEQSVLPGK